MNGKDKCELHLHLACACSYICNLVYCKRDYFLSGCKNVTFAFRFAVSLLKLSKRMGESFIPIWCVLFLSLILHRIKTTKLKDSRLVLTVKRFGLTRPKDEFLTGKKDCRKGNS